MSENEITFLVFSSVVMALINSIRAAYWKAKAETIDAERINDGWQNECMFLRRIVNKEAAEETEL